MSKLPETVSATLYVMLSDLGTVSVQASTGMTDYGWVVLSEHEVTYPVLQEDPTPKFIAVLEEKVERIQAEAHIEVVAVKEKIQQLKAIEYKGES
jgi:hypothetical protein